MISPLICANNFIKRSLETKTPLTQMKLQKLLYLLYAHYYAKHNQPLFPANFKKWPYGPVLPEVYWAFKHYGAREINKFHREPDGSVWVVDGEKDRDFSECFDDVWNRYCMYTGIQLSGFTHKKKSAWSKAKDEGDFLELEDIKEDGVHFFE